MGFIGRLFQRRETRNAITTSLELAQLIEQLHSVSSAAGISVTHEDALRCPAVAVSIKVIAESVAQLPFNVFRRGRDGTYDVADANPVNRLLSTHGSPNPARKLTSFEYRRWMTRHVALRGNAYSLIQRVGGEVDRLVPIHPRRVTPEEGPAGELRYTVTRNDGSRITYGQEDIFHLHGESDDGITGIDPIKQNAEAISLALAQDRFAGKMFGNGVKPSVAIEFPNALKEDAYKRLKDSFNEQYAGVENAHKAIILENGAKLNTISMTMEDAQLVESRTLQRSIVCSLWRLPPHVIGDLDKATFSNIENLARQMVDYALMPWLDMWQQAIEQQLMTEKERAKHVAKFNVNGLLRGDAKTRSEFYTSGITNGWLSPNEVREKEDMNPREGGDVYLTPLNMASSADNNDDAPAKERSINDNNTGENEE